MVNVISYYSKLLDDRSKTSKPCMGDCLRPYKNLQNKSRNKHHWPQRRWLGHVATPLAMWLPTLRWFAWGSPFWPTTNLKGSSGGQWQWQLFTWQRRVPKTGSTYTNSNYVRKKIFILLITITSITFSSPLFLTIKLSKIRK